MIMGGNFGDGTARKNWDAARHVDLPAFGYTVLRRVVGSFLTPSRHGTPFSHAHAVIPP
jgi:hypothetical protein